MQKLVGKVAVITGGSSGIGLARAKRFGALMDNPTLRGTTIPDSWTILLSSIGFAGGNDPGACGYRYSG
jgi:hypothetical protein